LTITTAIILAGGLGTRLQSAVPDLPKCMAPVAGKPFIAYVIDHLQQQGIQQFIFALGYKNESFHEYLSQIVPSGNYQLSIEKEPLGTGGAIKQACTLLSEANVLVANGDTLFKINLDTLDAFHSARSSQCTLCLKPMKQFNRYGVVELYPDQRISNFKEKQFYEEGYINGGIYALNSEQFTGEDLPAKFSFEKDYLEKLYKERRMYGLVQDGYFIDIGIPEDYERAQEELK
jgi:D-glycero-alpha-D-manno-heptose 1-phosphate guanylyltransferase